MKRKIQPKIEPVVPAEILEQAKQSISPDRLKKAAHCSVCGADTMVLAASEPQSRIVAMSFCEPRSCIGRLSS